MCAFTDTGITDSIKLPSRLWPQSLDVTMDPGGRHIIKRVGRGLDVMSPHRPGPYW